MMCATKLFTFIYIGIACSFVAFETDIFPQALHQLAIHIKQHLFFWSYDVDLTTTLKGDPTDTFEKLRPSDIVEGLPDGLLSSPEEVYQFTA